MNQEILKQKIIEILLEIEKLPKNPKGMSFNVKEYIDRILELFEAEKDTTDPKTPEQEKEKTKIGGELK